MTFEVKFTGNLYQDCYLLKRLSMVTEVFILLNEVQEDVRSRLKFGEGLTPIEIQFLEDLKSKLHSLDDCLE